MNFDAHAHSIPVPPMESLRQIAVECLQNINKEAEGQWDLPARLFMMTGTDLGQTEEDPHPELGPKRLAIIALQEFGSPEQPFGVMGSGDPPQDLSNLAGQLLQNAVLGPIEDSTHLRQDLIGYMFVFEGWGAVYDENNPSEIQYAPHDHPRRYDLRSVVVMDMNRDWVIAVHENPSSEYHSDFYQGEEPFVLDSENHRDQVFAAGGAIVESLSALCAATQMALVVATIRIKDKEENE